MIWMQDDNSNSEWETTELSNGVSVSRFLLIICIKSYTEYRDDNYMCNTQLVQKKTNLL